MVKPVVPACNMFNIKHNEWGDANIEHSREFNEIDVDLFLGEEALSLDKMIREQQYGQKRSRENSASSSESNLKKVRPSATNVFNQTNTVLDAKMNSKTTTLLNESNDVSQKQAKSKIEPVIFFKVHENPNKEKIEIYLKKVSKEIPIEEFRLTANNNVLIYTKSNETLNRGNRMCTIYFYIASAFDKVWHEGLIYKLIKLNFPRFMICWIHEFLSNRYFAVRINNKITEKLLITAGVPQGAVISPTLFSLYINDIPILYSRNKEYSLLFADDLCSSHIYKNKKSSIKRIQDYINKVEMWLKTWRLTMAPHKCNYIIFSNDKAQNEEDNLNIKLAGCCINKSENPSFLDIRYDKHL